ncbi:cuscuta receptor 1-like [Rhododendron vialii]|uniref:cuscuta receptor 1-like n=1 Tax=Rhododendron vialii TaxID=182163 RepID=UPI00265D774D|nr:cuscuta receptor 1-like [Rhododendron vialii]
MSVLGWRCFGCLEQERHALLTLKANINYPYFDADGDLPSWEAESALSCCEWERVECNNSTGRVTGLSLAGAMTVDVEFVDGSPSWFEEEDEEVGYFNGSLFLPFEELVNLDLSDNNISSWPQNEGFETLWRLGNLEVLDLSDNYFNYSILPSLSGLSSLKYLYLARNRLEGSNHSDSFRGLAGLKNLQVLDLSGNLLNRTIQSLLRLDDFVSLKLLDLSSTQIKSFELVQGLSSLSNLEDLYLGGSCLDDNFLQSIGVLASLNVLALSNCCLRGNLPTQGLCELRNLQELDLSGNQLEGALPPCLGNLKDLRVLDLSDNQLTGNIASSPLITLTSLVYLSLSSNHFLVPLSFGSFVNHSNLKVIFCDNNLFLAENESTTCAPTFQLNFLSLSNGTKGNYGIAFPSFLYCQYDLRIVEISHNNLNGTFPSWLLENNARLEGLYLSDNSLVGPLEFPSHPHLNILAIDISNNELGSRIPPNISLMFPNLTEVRMSGNVFEGNLITHLFRDMNDLWFIDLSNNLLSGVLPDYFTTRCATLNIIRLSNNNLSGKLSPSVFNLTSLVSLYLDGNNFTGNIPESLSLSVLQTLDISDNHFSGNLPRWIVNISGLRELVMPKNHFHGSIPLEFCQLQNLWFLDLSNNNLTGFVPSCLLNIRHLYLRRNRLEGPMPDGIAAYSFLITLDLSENSLSGIIPTWFSSLSSLTILLLKSNNFQGDIPSQLCQLDRLAMLDVSRNNLSGSLPPCLGKINRFGTNDMTLPFYVAGGFILKQSFLFVNSTMLSQTRKDSWRYDSPNGYGKYDLKQVVVFNTKWNSYSYNAKILSIMSGIDFSFNQFTGEIPPEIGNLSHIRALNLSHNNLSGPIPATFSNLRQLESLDLSYNFLKGEIPSQLVDLNSLAVFSVAHNDLSGKTPDRKGQFATFEESSYDENPLLCGPPLHNSCNKIVAQPQVPNAPENQEADSWLDANAFYGSFVGSYITVLLGIILVLYINPYWRRAWFNLIGLCLTESYYFVVDNFPRLSMFRKT